MIRKKTLASVMLATAMFGNSASAGIPTVDVIGNTMELINHIETIVQMVDQVNRMKEQLEQAERDFESFNGLRNMSKILTSTSDRQYLERNAGDLISLPAFDDFVNVQAVRLDQTRANIERVYNRASLRMDQLQELVDTIDTDNPKASMDLQNRIQAEQVFMQNDMIKVQMMTAQADVIRQQVEQAGRVQRAKFGQGESAVYVSAF